MGENREKNVFAISRNKSKTVALIYNEVIQIDMSV